MTLKRKEKLKTPLPVFKEECGVTENSIENARILLSLKGKPSLIVLTKDKNEYIVTAYWGEHFKFVFTGFGFGYGGTGPTGLFQYLTGLGVKVTMAQITAQMDKDLPKVFETP